MTTFEAFRLIMLAYVIWTGINSFNTVVKYLFEEDKRLLLLVVPVGGLLLWFYSYLVSKLWMFPF